MNGINAKSINVIIYIYLLNTKYYKISLKYNLNIKKNYKI